jgi:hypothetical protein
MQTQASLTANVSIDISASLSATNFSAANCASASNPTHASTVKEGGLVKFENDNYRITAGDNNEVNILDKHTGETTKIWGDPHVDVNGKHAFDFWGATTFNLKDGTKVTIDTTPFKDNPNVTLASKVTITNGDYGVQISGVDTNKVGDLAFEEGKGWGQLIDSAVADGNELYASQGGYKGVDGNGNVRNVDQNFINETDLQKGGAWKEQLQGLFAQLSTLVSIFSRGSFASSQSNADAGGAQQPPHHHFPHPGHHHHVHLPQLPQGDVFQPAVNFHASMQFSFSLTR